MTEGRQIPHNGEAIVLRTWPFHEADLLVSLFTREQGKVKGVARHAMKSRRRFGGALEPATLVRAHYTERPKQDLVRLDSFEILWSPLIAPIDYTRAAALQLVVEVLEEAMLEQAADDNVFRLAVTVLTAMHSSTPAMQNRATKYLEPAARENDVWLPITYFCLWMNRLMGWWPELGHCEVCGLDLRGSDAWWSPNADGVTCVDDRRPASNRLHADAVRQSAQMSRLALTELLQDDWPRERVADLRAFAIGMLERHLERRLRSATGLVAV